MFVTKVTTIVELLYKDVWFVNQRWETPVEITTDESSGSKLGNNTLLSKFMSRALIVLDGGPNT